MTLRIASTWYERTLGLLGCPPLAQQQGLWIKRCRAVHTFGMRYPIGLVFLDRHRNVIRVVPHLVPMRLAWCNQADSVIEVLPSALRTAPNGIQLIIDAVSLASKTEM
jgi:uncharacterized membrane protein (UPF0127 family)